MPKFVEDALRDEYGVDGDVRALPGELDLNFDIRTTAARYVFKVMRHNCDPNFIDLQVRAMERVRAVAPDLCVPSVIRSRHGAASITLVDDAGESRIAWLISFLPGRLLAHSKPWTPAVAANIGETMARLTQALEGFEHPLLDRPLKWDLRRGAWVADRLEVFDDALRRDIVEQIVTRFVSSTSPVLEKLPRTPIHGDANDMNILVSAEKAGENRVTGIIDFGDMVRSPRICETAISMAYIMMGEGDAIARGAALAGAFSNIIPLSDEEISLLLPMVKLRLAISVANSAIESKAYPDNDYLTISEAPAWALLEELSRLDETAVAAEFFTACRNARPETAKTKTDTLLARRRRFSPGNLSLSYDAPLNLVRGERHFLYDDEGAEYLDAYNNVPHVGHADPTVIEAVAHQLRLINTNTRYLQDVHVDYAEHMLALMPASISKIVFLNSASEANELALRLARAATSGRDMLVMEHAYHGATTGAMDISPYKFNHPKGAGAPDWVHVASQPDIYRGRHRGADASQRYVDDARRTIEGIAAAGRRLAGFICECLPSVGGQIVLPNDYLKTVYQMVRAAGGVCIADDVQTALGRLGAHFWGFEQQGATPDIVVLGKPLGNGYPLAAVAMTESIADAFADSPEFFSTFGGSSGACAAGRAVLDVLAAKRLQENARKIGAQMLDGLEGLARRHEIIGDVRGMGFFLGVELVLDRQTRVPAAQQANYVKNRMREQKVLIGVDGPDENVLKIRPPMTFDAAAADRLLTILEEILGDDSAQA